MNWIKVGLKEFTQYLAVNNKENINRQKPEAIEIESEQPINCIAPTEPRI
jgi:hypothetical protein